MPKQQPSSDDERLAQISHDVFNAVLDKGYIIHFVGADAASVIHQNQPFAYTVGRTLVERPEFLVTGMPAVLAKPVLEALVAYDSEHHVAGVIEGLAGTFPRISIGPGHDLRMKLVLSDTAPLLGALTEFGLDKVRALQALWPRGGGYPDLNDRWPDQPIHPYGETPLIGGADPYRK